MTMLAIAVLGVRHRAGGFVATLLATVLGATILMAFASMLDIAGGAEVDAVSAETLTTMTTVAGGWCLLIVVFAVASTLTLSVRQRSAELAVLRSAGATPAQVRRMIVGEASSVALVAALIAVAPAMLLGRLLLGLLRDTGQVAPSIGFRFGPIALGMGVGVTVLGAALAALLTARRVARLRAAEALRASVPGADRLSRRRVGAAVALIAVGSVCGVLTATVMADRGADAMQTAGQAGIWAGIGLALLAPALVRGAAAALARPLRAVAGVAGELTATNLRVRGEQLAAVVMPVVLFTAISTGTLYMQRIEDRATAAAGAVQRQVEKNIETLNYVVVGMIALFAAIMLVNTLVTAMTHRRREFGQQRLAGATAGQVLAMVTLESALLVTVGVLFGSVASLVTIVPYGIARSTPLADTDLDRYAAIVAVAVLLTLAAGVGATGRALRAPAVAAVAG